LNKLERQDSSPDPSNVEGHAAIDNAAFESCDGGMKWSIINFKVYKAISEGFHLLAFLYVQNGNNSEIQCWEGTSQQFLSSFIFPGTSSVRTVTNSVLASHLQGFFRLQPTFGLIENSQTKVPGLAAAVAGTTMAEEGSVVGGKDGCLRIVPYCPMKEPSSSNGMVLCRSLC